MDPKPKVAAQQRKMAILQAHYLRFLLKACVKRNQYLRKTKVSLEQV